MILPTLEFESSLWAQGKNFICGIDEVGRGSWAGPLVVAGVILPVNFKIPEGLADSKLVKPNLRKKLSSVIQQLAIGFKIVEISPNIINKIGLGMATNVAFRKVVHTISPSPDYCLIDAFYIKHFSRKKQAAIKHGDQICASIAAASIVAKVYRDNLMKKIAKTYPAYGFAKHKGYGTKFHQEAIKQFGFCQIHRTSYNLNFLWKQQLARINPVL